MIRLTDEHISFIIKDLNRAGLIVEGLQEEIVDHVCCLVETRMNEGQRFREAYDQTIQSFGNIRGLHHTQRQVLQANHQTPKDMFRNYITIAFRNLLKQRFYTFINVVGLAVGVAACLVIVLFVMNELGYDRHHEKADRIFRVNSEIKFGGNHYQLATTPAPTASALLMDFPEIENAVRFRSRGSYLIKTKEDGDNIKEERAIWTDSTFFAVFSIPMLEGNPNTALSEPNSVVISERLREKLFPSGNALGSQLILDNHLSAKVTGVYQNMPESGHFAFEIMIAMSGLDEAQQSGFLSNNFNTYVLLREGADPKALESKLPGFIVKYVGPQAAQVLGSEFSMEAFEAAGNKWECTLMPIRAIHLHSDRTAELAANSDITYVYLFGAIALFILAIACINFMNLSTARSSNRAKEVGIRKVMGSLRKHLVRQFLMESTLLSALAFGLALGLAWMFLPVFNELSQKSLRLPLDTPGFYVLIGLAILLVGGMAGLYPSFFLSAFKPVNVLKGKVALGMKSGLIRSSLVVFQFMISIFLIIATLTVQRQLDYIQNKKIGFNKEQVILVNDAYALGDNIQPYKQEILRNNFISHGTITGYLPVNSWRSDNTYWPEGTQPTQDNMVGMQTWDVDHDYVQTMGMKIKYGRFFAPEYPSDSSAVVVNEAALAQFGIDGDPIGRRITTFTGTNPDGTPDMNSIRSFTIVGVVENFHFESLRENIGPLGLFLKETRGHVVFRFETANTEDVIAVLEKTWKEMAPGQPFQYSFLDEAFSNMYTTESRVGRTFAIFSGLAIIIACLGLFALTAFTAEQRTKEIGIRKVLGASVNSIVLLLSKEFGKLIIIAFVLAAPLAWYAVNWWLKGYTYKVEVGILVYVGAGVFALAIAWITMGFQSVRAATSDPVKSLRSE